MRLPLCWRFTAARSPAPLAMPDRMTVRITACVPGQSQRHCLCKMSSSSFFRLSLFCLFLVLMLCSLCIRYNKKAVPILYNSTLTLNKEGGNVFALCKRGVLANCQEGLDKYRYTGGTEYSKCSFVTGKYYTVLYYNISRYFLIILSIF